MPMITDPTVKQATTISMSRELLEAARRVAREERRTLSAQIEVWMIEHLTKREAAKRAAR